MTRDNPETVTLNDPTAWQETAMPAAASVDPDPRVRVSQDDLMAAVHGGVVTGAQAKALWLRWSDPGQAAAQASNPGPRSLPESPVSAQPASGSGPGAVVTLVLVVAAAVAGWVLRGLMHG